MTYNFVVHSNKKVHRKVEHIGMDIVNRHKVMGIC